MRGQIAIILLLMTRALTAQNLVPNPGFEQIKNCPFGYNTVSGTFPVPGWNSPTQATPDFFNVCGASESGVPDNWAGKATPHGGKGYAGLCAWGNNGKSYREYIQCKLTEPMIAGKEYQLGFYFKLSSSSKYKTDRIGMILLDSALKLSRNKVFRMNPALSVIRTPAEDGEWDQARMIYQAHGGERFLVIGNFFDDHSTESVRLDFRKIKNAMLSNIAYFYIDDVSVIPADQIEYEEVVATRKQEVIFSLKNIQFDFNSDKLVPLYLVELDKLATVLKRKPHLNIELTGYTDDVGSETYNLDLSRSRAKNVGKYLASKGIDAGRITTKGQGEAVLMQDGDDEYARKLNRRVEVQFVERQLDKSE